MDTSALGRRVHGEAEASARKRGTLIKRAVWVLAFLLLALGYGALEPVTSARGRLDACVAAYDGGSRAASADAHAKRAAQSEDTYGREQRLSGNLLACSVQP